ncbi:MAG TPA: putative toxin-antitoxin system toxin component, PIN family [Chitinophagaceae bacterium]|jgi:putative PIN family toxin of toxin-antitoxin system|nr:putative toxin-antitoxin system toxin component, PIN family [Chitinophagaceae bacterium]
MQATSIKVIFDTNVWISFLIGKRLAVIKDYLISSYITLIITQQLVTEIKNVTGREKLKKYFPKQSVNELIELLEAIAITVTITPVYFINKDPKDNFLLDLIHFSKADYLVTGDKALLEHNPFKTATILTPINFEKVIKQYK